MSVAQDADGFMWFGTPGGLARWDGYRMLVFRHDNQNPGSLPENIVPTLLVDERGTLWMGTVSGLVARYDGTRFITYRQEGSGRGRLRDLASDGNGGVWAAGQFGLAHLDLNTGLWRYNDADAGDVSSLLRDRSGALWLGAPAGLVRRQPNTARFELVSMPEEAGRLTVTALFEDQAGLLWFGTSTGRVGTVDPLSGTARLIEALGPSGQQVTSIVEPRPGVLWISELGGGIRELLVGSGTVHSFRHDPTLRDGLADDTIMAMTVDRSGLVWAVGRGGVDSHNPRTGGIATLLPNAVSGLIGKDVRSMATRADGSLWMGFGAEGLARLDLTTGEVTALHPAPTALPRSRAQAVAAMDNGDVWVGYTRGLYRVDGATGRVSPFALLDNANIMELRNDPPWLWAGGTMGLMRIDPRNGQAITYRHTPGKRSGLSDNSVLSLLPTGDGRLWVGTQRGLNLFDIQTETFRRILQDPNDPASLPNDVINALLEDRSGRLWVATANGIGILNATIDGKPRFLHLTTAHGLPHGTVTVLLEDTQGMVWAGTGDGLAIINPRTLAIRSLGPADGAGIRTTWAGSGARLPDGTLLFGGLGGLTVVQPDRLREWTFHPPVAITAVQVGDSAVSLPLPPTGLVVQPDDRGLEVTFAALDFSAPERNRYAYRLDGFDEDWISADATYRKAIYTNLAPGSYRLLIRGSNRRGVWSEPPLSLPIEVLPAWHQSLWVNLAEAITALLLLVATIQGRTAWLRRRQRDLTEQVARRTEELELARATAIAREDEAHRAREEAEAANRAKSRFLAVASHEIRTPLNGVLGMLQMLDTEALTPEQRQYLNIAKLSGGSLIGLIDSILDYGRHEVERDTADTQVFDPRPFANQAIELFRPQAVANGILLELEVTRRVPAALRCDQVRLARILRNLLANAIKFTPKGMVEVLVDLVPAEAGSPALLRIDVSDTGIGIAPDMCEAIFNDFVQADDSIARRFGGTGLGLAICRRAAALMGGALTVDSDPTVGSTFHLTVPVEPCAAIAVTPPAATVTTTGRLSILLVDDDEINRRVGAGLLDRLGHRVTVVDDGASAVEAASTTDFDVILMDLHMSGLDGIEASRRIRALPDTHRAEVPIIAVTADVTSDTRDSCALAGINQIIGKPLHLDILRHSLTPPRGSTPAIPSAVVEGETGWVNLSFLANQWEVLGTADLVRLGRLFHRASRQMITELEEAGSAGDRATIQALAHRLCSSAGALGLARLSAHAKAIELDAPFGATAALATRIALLRPLRRGSIAAAFAAARGPQAVRTDRW